MQKAVLPGPGAQVLKSISNFIRSRNKDTRNKDNILNIPNLDSVISKSEGTF